MSTPNVRGKHSAAPLSRRTFLRLSSTVIGAAALAACVAPGASAPAGSAPEKQKAALTFLSGGWFVPELVQSFDAFSKKWATENNVDFTIDLVTKGLNEKLAAAIEAKQGANLAQIDYSPTSLKAAVADVSDIAKDLITEQGDYYPTPTYQCRIDGKWLAIPYGQHPRMVNYREDWYKEVGYDKFPDTWDETLEAGRKLKEKGHPYGWTMSEQSPADGVAACLTLLWSFGGKEWNDDGSVALESQATVDALNFAIQLYKDTCDPAVTSYQEASNNQAFLAGQISMTYNVNSIYTPALKDAPDVAKNMNHVAPPEGPGGRYGYTGVAEMILLNYTQGAELDAAQKFMRDFFSIKTYGDFLKLGNGYLIPATAAYDDKPIWPEDPKLAAVRTVGAIGRLNGFSLPFPNAAAATMQTQVVIPKMFSAACTSGDANAALAGALQEIKDIQAQSA
ncbi:ABC transporter substrate-binding protein [soil metagenome]